MSLRAHLLLWPVCLVLFTILPRSVLGDTHASLAEIDQVRGQLRAVQKATLSAGREGKISAIAVQLGQLVNKGDALVVLDCNELKAQRDVVRAQLQAAKDRYHVNERLAKVKNISPLELTLSGSEVDVAHGELNQIRARFRDCQVVAPFDARIVERFADPHEYIRRGDPLLTLVNPHQFEIDMVIPSLWLSRVAVGTLFSFHIDETGSVHAATLRSIVGQVDPISQTARVIGQFEQSVEGLLPGMSGVVRFSGKDGWTDGEH